MLFILLRRIGESKKTHTAPSGAGLITSRLVNEPLNDQRPSPSTARTVALLAGCIMTAFHPGNLSGILWIIPQKSALKSSLIDNGNPRYLQGSTVQGKAHNWCLHSCNISPKRKRHNRTSYKNRNYHKSQSDDAQNRPLCQNSKAEFFPTDRNVEVDGKNNKV